MEKLFKEILLSSVYDVVRPTPTDKALGLSALLGNEVFLKREDLQPVFSFKIRGAYNRISKLTELERKKGVICASAGNHAQGVAFSCQKLGIEATVVMPCTTPKIKVDAVLGYGAEVILHGDSYSEAGEYCKQLAKEKDLVFIHPFDDLHVIAGQGTIGKEILEDCPKVDIVFLPVGGGGLIAGVACYIKTLCPHVKIIGVEPVESNAMGHSISLGKNTALDEVGIFADGVAVKKVGDLNFELCQKYVDEFITVTTDEICFGIKKTYEEFRTILEPAGAVSLAGLMKYSRENKLSNQKLVGVNSGANMNFQRLQFVAERTMTGEGREALYAIELQEKPGTLFDLCRKVLGEKNVTEFNYRLKDKAKAFIFLGIEVSDSEDKDKFEQKLRSNEYSFIDLTNNELAKTHVRHMVGGTSVDAGNERLFRFEFPERANALNEFLERMSGRWNISLFHYRSQGSDFGRVLLGLQIQDHDTKELDDFLVENNYAYKDESANAAYEIFLKVNL